MEQSVDLVETQYYTFARPPGELALENGGRLGPITVAYEAYGKLNVDKSNAILILHAFSGDAHAAGWHRGDKKPGWWDNMIGPGKAFDTDKHFIVCSNVIGGCKGSTGPSSVDPLTGKEYGLTFPEITISDMVEVQRHLLKHLGIERLFSVAGGSMGGQQVLEWLVAHPDLVRSAIIIATASKHSPQQIAFNEVGRQAIMADRSWRNGDYYGMSSAPAKGLAVARMIGHITYMSDFSMSEKFGRGPGVESYLHYQGRSFVDRFDANSYLYITRAVDSYNAWNGKGINGAFKELKTKVLVLSFKSDWLYPSYQSLEIVRAFKRSGVDVTYCEVDSTYGHDAFLLEADKQTYLITHFLHKVASGTTEVDYEI